MESPRASAYCRRGALPAMDTVAAAGSRPRGGACDLGEGRLQARDRCCGASPDDKPPLLRLVLREVQGPGASSEGLPRILAAADGVRGAGDAGSRVARGDLAFRDAARLERTFSELPPSGPAHGPLRPLEGKSLGLHTRKPGLSGRGPETRNGALPAAQVQADGGDLRFYAQRSSTRGFLVRRGLATQTEEGLPNAPWYDEAGLDLCRVPEGALQRRREDLLAPLYHQRSFTGAGWGKLGLGAAPRRIEHGPGWRKNENTEGQCREDRGSGGHTSCFGASGTQAKTFRRGGTTLQRVRVRSQRDGCSRASRSISSGRVRKPYPLALRLLMMSETAATVWERSALGKASVSWPSWSKATPPGPTPCNMRRWIMSLGRRYQSQAITDQPTHLIPSSSATEITCGPYRPWGTRKSCGRVPVAPWMASWPRSISSLTFLGRLHTRCGWVNVWLPTSCWEATSAARFGSRMTLLPTWKKVALMSSRPRISSRCPV